MNFHIIFPLYLTISDSTSIVSPYRSNLPISDLVMSASWGKGRLKGLQKPGLRTADGYKVVPQLGKLGIEQQQLLISWDFAC